MDHSGYDASAFLIEIEGKKIFYSGDFRGHGRKATLLENLARKPIAGVDCLLMEGTTLGGGHKAGFQNEQDVENALCDIFYSQADASFIMAAGSNIDRLVSIYKAAQRSKKTLVLDLYTYYVLNKLKELTPSLPPHSGDHLRVFYIRKHAQDIADHLGKELLYRFKDRKIEINEIFDRRQEMVLKLPISAMKRVSTELVKIAPFEKSKFIYSMWAGYLEKDNSYHKFCKTFNLELMQVHVSGHAYLDALRTLAGALKPKMLIPVHTLSSDSFSNYFDNVIQLDDGDIFNL